MKRARYKRDKPGDFRPHEDGSLPFSAFIISEQMRKPLHRAAIDIIAIAKTFVPPSADPRNGHYSDHFAINEAAATTKASGIGRRAVVEIINDYPSAAAMEYGSGDPSIGTSAGQERPQGGWNKPKRPLGRAAGRVGDWRE